MSNYKPAVSLSSVISITTGYRKISFPCSKNVILTFSCSKKQKQKIRRPIFWIDLDFNFGLFSSKNFGHQLKLNVVVASGDKVSDCQKVCRMENIPLCDAEPALTYVTVVHLSETPHHDFTSIRTFFGHRRLLVFY